MFDFLEKLFDTSGFPPRWHCGSWTAGHGWLHIASDLGVWLAYLAIPCVFTYFIMRRRDIPFRLVFVLFGAFILACGTTHLMEALIFWWPAYRLAGLIKLVTAIVSWATVFALVQVTPRALLMRTPEELEREIGVRKRVEDELRRSVEALQRSEAMFQGLFQFAPDALLVTDPQGRIRQANLASERTFGYSREELIGQSVEALMPDRSHESHLRLRAGYTHSLSAQPISEGQALYGRRKDGAEFPVDVTLAPLETTDEPLTLSTIRDISHRKANEDLIKARTLRQAALADFGRRAFASTDLDAQMDEAASVATSTLDGDLGFLAEVIPNDHQMVLRSSWGWRDGRPGQPVFDIGPASQGYYCLAAGRPVIVTDLRTESRFMPSEYLLKEGAVGGIYIDVIGKIGPHGILGVLTRRPRQFTVEDRVFLQSFANLLAALIDRARAEQRVQASLAEKNVLLREVHHRVKNNLQVISSLLDLQSSFAADPASVELFHESMNRVRSMALVHEMLYRSGDLANVDFAAYIEGLAEYLFRAYLVDANTVRLDIQAAPDLCLPVDAAVPCGLLLNELLSNCLKHAFRGKESGTVRIVLSRVDGNKVGLSVADDGIGLPPDFVDIRQAKSFGLQLVAMLADQLKAATEVVRTGGTMIGLTFPAPAPAATRHR
jgi:PAS domain S-box-containing protein